MTENEWLVYGAAEAQGTTSGETADMMSTDIDMAAEIKAVDEHMVRYSFTGETLAGDKVEYSWSNWNQLQMKVKGRKMSGGVMKGMIQWLATSDRFHPVEEITFENQWSMMKGMLTINGKDRAVQILYRGNKPISITKEGTKVAKTIKFYEAKVYRTNLWKNMRISSLREFRPEQANDVYKGQSPEFTRVDELEEIRAFINGLRNRELSWEEAVILGDIKSELGMLEHIE